MRTLLLCLAVAATGSGVRGEESSLRILRPKMAGEQVSPTWTELYYLVIDARHPDGVEKLQLFQEGAKKAEKAFSEKDRHESGYFFYKRRMKSEGVREYVIKMWPGGTDPEVDEPLVSERTFPIRYENPDPDLPNHVAFTNLRDGEVIPANDPRNSEDLTHILVDCQDASGTWGGGQWKEHRHMGYRDDDGIDWVELRITNSDGDEEVVRKDSAFLSDVDLELHGPYWGEAVDPTRKKRPEESWPEGTEWKPIEGFGLHHFAVPLAPGTFQVGIRAQNQNGEIIEGPVIRITATTP